MGYFNWLSPRRSRERRQQAERNKAQRNAAARAEHTLRLRFAHALVEAAEGLPDPKIAPIVREIKADMARGRMPDNMDLKMLQMFVDAHKRTRVRPQHRDDLDDPLLQRVLLDTQQRTRVRPQNRDDLDDPLLQQALLNSMIQTRPAAVAPEPDFSPSQRADPGWSNAERARRADENTLIRERDMNEYFKRNTGKQFNFTKLAYGSNRIPDDIGKTNAISEEVLDPLSAVYLTTELTPDKRITYMYNLETLKAILQQENPLSPYTRVPFTVANIRRVKEAAVRNIIKNYRENM